MNNQPERIATTYFRTLNLPTPLQPKRSPRPGPHFVVPPATPPAHLRKLHISRAASAEHQFACPHGLHFPVGQPGGGGGCCRPASKHGSRADTEYGWFYAPACSRFLPTGIVKHAARREGRRWASVRFGGEATLAYRYNGAYGEVGRWCWGCGNWTRCVVLSVCWGTGDFGFGLFGSTVGWAGVRGTSLPGGKGDAVVRQAPRFTASHTASRSIVLFVLSRSLRVWGVMDLGDGHAVPG